MPELQFSLCMGNFSRLLKFTGAAGVLAVTPFSSYWFFDFNFLL